MKLSLFWIDVTLHSSFEQGFLSILLNHSMLIQIHTKHMISTQLAPIYKQIDISECNSNFIPRLDLLLIQGWDEALMLLDRCDIIFKFWARFLINLVKSSHGNRKKYWTHDINTTCPDTQTKKNLVMKQQFRPKIRSALYEEIIYRAHVSWLICITFSFRSRVFINFFPSFHAHPKDAIHMISSSYAPTQKPKNILHCSFIPWLDLILIKR